MKLGLEQIKSVVQGAEKIAYESGRYRFIRFNDEEIKLLSDKRYECTSGIIMEFKTDGRRLRFKGNTERRIPTRTFYSFDVFVENKLIGCIKNFDDEECKGNYASEEYKLGEFLKEFELGGGEKTVKIVFPHSVYADIEEIELADASYLKPVPKTKNIVFYGDSITQGYDALHPSKNYAFRLAEYFNAQQINKGIGGLTFDVNFPKIKNEINAEFVIVAYGTNDWGMSNPESFYNNANEFLKSVEENYPHTPVFVITPLWRKDKDEEKPFGKFEEIENITKKVAAGYKNIKVISGIDLIPNNENMFGDLWLHPSDEGFEHYFNNLVNEIERIKDERKVLLSLI